MTISVVHKPDNSESYNSVKVSYINVQGLPTFVGRECFLESNSPDISASSEANLGDSIDSSKFSGNFRSYVPFF